MKYVHVVILQHSHSRVLPTREDSMPHSQYTHIPIAVPVAIPHRKASRVQFAKGDDLNVFLMECKNELPADCSTSEEFCS